MYFWVFVFLLEYWRGKLWNEMDIIEVEEERQRKLVLRVILKLVSEGLLDVKPYNNYVCQ